MKTQNLRLVCLLNSALLLLFSSSVNSADKFLGPYMGSGISYGEGVKTGDHISHISSYNNAYDVLRNIPYHYDVKAQGLSLGVTAGYNFKFKDQIIYGLELEHNQSNNVSGQGNLTLAANAYSGGACAVDSTAKQKLKAFNTLKLRMGFAPQDNINIYASLGPALGKVKTNISHKWSGTVGGCSGPAEADDGSFELGYAASLGAEYLLNNNLSLKAEYTRLDLGDRNMNLYSASDLTQKVADYNFRNEYDFIKFGINYYFK
jgi:outer membrane immunogenic protein